MKEQSIISLKQRREDAKLRKSIRKMGIGVYQWKWWAIRKAKKLTSKYKIVYWVNFESIGYYVINLNDIKKLNKSLLKRKGEKKIHTRDLDKECIWRSPLFHTL